MPQAIAIRPMIPVLAAFSAGILLRSSIQVSVGMVTLLFLFSLFIASYFTLSKLSAASCGESARQLSLKSKGARWVVLLPFLFLGVLFAGGELRDNFGPGHILHYVDIREGGLGIRVEGRVYRVMRSSGERSRLFIEVNKVILGGHEDAAYGRVLLTVGGPDAGMVRGDRVRFLSRLKRPKNFGNPGEYDYEGALRREGIYVTAFIDSARWIVRLYGEADLLRGWIEGARGSVRAFIEGKAFANGGIMKALLLGDRGGVPGVVRDGFARTGTAHLLAISGLHVGAAAFLVYAVLFRIFSASERCMLALDIRKLSILLSLPVVLFYTLLTGLSLPTVRAAIMVAAFAIAIMLDRERDIYNILASAALAILLFSPMSLFEASFQLSFIAVLSIVYITPRLRGIFPGDDSSGMKAPSARLPYMTSIMDKGLFLFLVSLSAAVGTAPIVAYHFQMVPVLGPLANIVAVPLVGFIVVPVGLFALAFIPLWEGMASLLLMLVDAVLAVVVKFIAVLAALPFTSISAARPALAEIVLIYLIIPAMLIAIGNRRVRPIFSLLAALLIAIYGYRYCRNNYDGDLRLTFISVGQGDAALVEFPYGKRMLIDGGGFYGTDFDVGERVLAPFLRQKGIGRIDYVVLSHPQIDHAGGLRFVVENFGVEEFWWNGDGGLRELSASLERRGVPTLIKDASTPPVVINGVRVEFLYPDKDTLLDGNNRSLVLRLGFKGVTFLFTGDLEEEAEHLLLSRRPGLRSTVLKVPHHGSRSSSMEKFIDTVRPGAAVVSAGYRNPFGFPHKEVVERYTQAGVALFRTDRDGAVMVETDGHEVDIKGYLTDRRWWGIL